MKQRKLLDRILAVTLSLLLVLGMLPVSTPATLAATDAHPDVFTAEVTDGAAPIAGASIHIYNNMLAENSFDYTEETDENGIAAFAELAEAIAACGEDVVTVNYEITAVGYDHLEEAVEVSAEEAAAYHLEAELQKSATVETATIIVSASGGQALVEINGKEQLFASANVGSYCSVKVTPEDGYAIKNVRVNLVDIDKAKLPAVGEAYEDSIYVDSDVMVSVELERYYSLSVSKTGNGTVLLNGVETESTLAVGGSFVKVDIMAEEGYCISSVSIDGEALADVMDAASYSFNAMVTRDTVISVVFTQIWTVTVTHTGDGKVDISPTGQSGTVTVTDGTLVQIKAIPGEGYRVVDVKINDVADTTVTGENGSGYEKSIVAEQAYTVEITFGLNVYRVAATATENGTVIPAAATVDHGGETKVYMNPAEGYTIGSISVNGISVTEVEQDESGVYFVLGNITEDQNVTVTFKPVAQGSAADVTVDDSAVLRVVDGPIYVVKNGTYVIYTTTRDGIRLYDNGGKLLDGGADIKTVSVADTTVSKVQLYYQAEGELIAHWHNVTMDAMTIVADVTKPNLTMGPASNPNIFGYYNSNVIFSVNIADPASSSGLDYIQYQITCNGVASDPVDIYRYTYGTTRDTYLANRCFTVDASIYGGDAVKVSVTVADRAGNVTVAEKTLKINSNVPTVTLDITGTQNVNALDGYYKDERVLTITINDRYDTFDPTAVAQGMKLYINGKAVTVSESDISWERSLSKQVGTYRFSEDGTYAWSFSYTNKAGLSNTKVIAPEDKDIYAFIIDKAEPHSLKVTYSPTFVDTVLEAITFGFYNAPVEVTVEAADETAGIDRITYSYKAQAGAEGSDSGMENVVVPSADLIYIGKKASTSFTIPAQFRGNVSFTATDKAGRSATMTDGERVVVVDTVAPGVTVEYDNAEAQNGIYYKDIRTATIRVEEANFFAEDLEDGKLVLAVTKTYNDGRVSNVNLKPEFKKDGSTYVATIAFDEDADYTFDVTYTDRAGNVFDSYAMDSFTEDLTDPVIEVSYSNNDCENGNFFSKQRVATIQITEHNFSTEKVSVAVTRDGEAAASYAAYLAEASNWTHNGDVHTAKLTFSESSHYTFSISCEDLAGRTNNGVSYGNSVAPEDFIIDTGAPRNLKISYEPSFTATVLEALTFGFYQAPVDVTIEATDATSGVDYFTYSYEIQEGASSTNTGAKDVKVSDPERDGDRAYTTFTIPAQFRGYVSFTATDKAGYTATMADTKVVVIDTVAPGITVSYDNNNAANGNYYNADRTATVQIEEANFFVQDIEDGLLEITVGKTDINGNYTETKAKPSFTKDGDVYTAQIVFDTDGEYTFDIKYTDRSGNVYDSYEQDSFIIDKTAPVMTLEYGKETAADGYYFNGDVFATLTVTEHNFRPEDMEVNISAADFAGTKDIDLSIKHYESYLKDPQNWLRDGDTWTTVFTMDIEGVYVLALSYADLGGTEATAIKETFCIDRSAPVELAITYEPSFLDTVLEALTFGFYQAPVQVTLEAKDEYAGVERFIYSYDVQEGASSTNSGRSNVVIDAADIIHDGNVFSASFEIPAQFRGSVSFTAEDYLGHKAAVADDTIIVVDNVAPGINVSYDNMNASYESYYSADRTATITVKEANFFEEDLKDGLLVITVGKTLNDGTHTETNVQPTFTKNGDVYTATVEFTEDADYTFDIKYTDRSGNVYDSYEADEFTIDKIAPVIRVSYDNNSCKNEDQFNADRTATITVTEHNFHAADVLATVQRDGSFVQTYADYLSNDANWSHNGDVHTATISFTAEARYTFAVSASDLAGNSNAGVDYGNSAAPTAFTLDKSAPTDLTATIDGVSVLGTDSIAFDTFYMKELVVKLGATCDISGLEAISYQKVARVADYDPNGAWTIYNDETGIVVSPSERFIVYFRAEDRAGNMTYANTTGIVTDNQMPTGEINAPEIDILPAAANVNGYHNADVEVNLKVMDPKYLGAEANADGHYSGLNRITYRIYTADTDALVEGTLLDLNNGTVEGGQYDNEGLIGIWSGKITIAAETFNSDHIVVEVTAIDNAGNERTSRMDDVKIDTTAPAIRVSYSNNNADIGSCFKASRTATIVITERNFRPEDVELILTNAIGEVPALSEWTKTEGTGNGDDITWTATLVYDQDGDYEFDIAYTDPAGNANTDVDYGRSVAPNAFTIDMTAPAVTVTYDNNDVYNGSYYQAERTATIAITDRNLNTEDLERVVITVTAEDAGAELAAPAVSAWTSENNIHTATIRYDQNANYTFDIQVTDNAGNEFDAYEADAFTVDLIDPVIEVSYINNDSLNENYFAQERIAQIKITDKNFSAADVAANITRDGVFAQDYADYLADPASWTHNGEEHTAQITFADNCRYSFGIGCKDLAGRSNQEVIFDDSVASEDFVIDMGVPTDLKISYAPDFVATVLEAITFGFYQAPVTVTVEAVDATSGIDYFTYSYEVQEGASTVNSGVKDVILRDVQYDGTRAYATFTIPAQFRGYVSFTATDRAGYEASFVDEKVVVVDTVAPGITVSYDNNNPLNGSYYNTDRTATIRIEEANFFAEDIKDGLLEISIGKTLNDGTHTEWKAEPVFSKDGDVYTAEILFGEDADYTFDIKYTDRSGNVYDSYEQDSFTVDKIAPVISVEYGKASAIDGYYFHEDITATFTVEEHNFRASDLDFQINAVDITGSKTVDLSAKAYADHLKKQDSWTLNGNTWTAQILIDIEGVYDFSMSYADLAGHEQTAPIAERFCLDKTAPSELKISYEPTFVGTLLEALTFGFYQAPVKVTLEAKDEYSGVNRFVYSYTVQEGASSTNRGKTDVEVTGEDIVRDGSLASVSFEIPAQFRGFVSFVAEDVVGNETALADETVIVVDNVAPGISVSYDNTNAKYDTYYDKPRTATITIKEANFFAEDLRDGLLVITVGKTLNDGTYTETKVQPEFAKNRDVYTATVDFTEDADYTFDIKYTDRSGNVYDSYETDSFTVDKTVPIIEVSYDNNSCKNGDQFNADRTATIVITEHNFIASDVIGTVKANNAISNAYTEFLSNDANWIHAGDVHTAAISFTEEAHYTFDITATDMAGNGSFQPNYGASIAPTAFTLDKTAPTDLQITINEKSVLGTDSIAFDTFYNGAVAVKLNAVCDISGLEALSYQKVAHASEYDINGVWTPYNSETGIVVTPSERFIIYFRAEDRAGNVSYANSTGIVADNQAPTGETKAPDIDIIPAAGNDNGIHRSDVPVSIKVIDPKYLGAEQNANGHYSGLKKITYQIKAEDTNTVVTGTLMDLDSGMTTGASFDSDNLVNAWQGKITVDAARFNSNSVVVTVTAIDNAGNERATTTQRGSICIDTTPPRIDVTYSNNNADNGTYFKENRTATITITERNFRGEDVRLTLSNNSGPVPGLSGWTKSEAAGNGDANRWTATLSYVADGDYRFDIAYTDLAGNAAGNVNYGNSVAPKEFTIDKTVPTVTVTYDNNDAKNGNYYQKDRTATITITERNLTTNDAGRVTVTVNATDDGKAVAAPGVSGWSSNGSTHTATIHYKDDARYTFNISIRDKAGNQSAAFEQHTFYVDQTAPELEITGVENNSANTGDVKPVVTYTDTNYDAQQVEITLNGANRKDVVLDGEYGTHHNGGSFAFRNFPVEQDVDDIYTLTATLTDKAGNTSTETVVFSVNRFGSTYEMSEETDNLNGSYVSEPVDVVVSEINANELEDIKITLFKNNETIVLTEGEDYSIAIEGGNGEWYRYTYTVFAKNFADDGVYRLAFHSEDAAGNVAENTLDTKDKELTFGIDKTKPNVVVTNLEDGETYAYDLYTVRMTAGDNLLLGSLTVYLDDYGTAYKTWNAEEIAAILSENGEFTFDVSGDSTDAHKVKVVCVDAAGNETQLEIEDFYVTTNILIRFLNNKPLFYGSIGLLLAIIALIIFLIVKKRKKEKPQTPEAVERPVTETGKRLTKESMERMTASTKAASGTKEAIKDGAKASEKAPAKDAPKSEKTPAKPGKK